mgnify:CR=1 FL=1
MSTYTCQHTHGLVVVVFFLSPAELLHDADDGVSLHTRHVAQHLDIAHTVNTAQHWGLGQLGCAAYLGDAVAQLVELLGAHLEGVHGALARHHLAHKTTRVIQHIYTQAHDYLALTLYMRTYHTKCMY